MTMQPRLLLLPISSHGLTTATVSSWVHLTLSSSLSKKQSKLCCKTRSFGIPPRHSTPLEKLHWLPISERIKYKVSYICFSAINDSGPHYLSELLYVYTPSRTLRSFSDTRMLKIQQYKRKTHGFSTFSCFGSHTEIQSHKTLDTNINTKSLCVRTCVCVCLCVCFMMLT